ncbi:hypothetical protein CPAR01_10833 [Colletotrichum paranaense]|uniref:Uncharacterized protein n=1 Tax=Colletotrichum paranaense TaxID=1914294 RepID=A0ABQ9S9W6_9PEZI|nr:uncharacterized protein CPAR01_10833 [Colletotrichum paranaense]KAK1531184.1 hypothetical protein CPAR01_10833 [Colletotrichum paranaense]
MSPSWSGFFSTRSQLLRERAFPTCEQNSTCNSANCVVVSIEDETQSVMVHEQQSPYHETEGGVLRFPLRVNRTDNFVNGNFAGQEKVDCELCARLGLLFEAVNMNDIRGRNGPRLRFLPKRPFHRQ